MSIAQLDVNRIMAQLSLDSEQARLFKETFLQLGANLLSPPSTFDKYLNKQIGG